MKKTIGIYADTFNGKIGQTFAYMQFFSQFGFVRLLSTLDNLQNIENEIDVLVLPGGADVDVATYNAIPGVMDSRTNQHYEFLDKVLLPKFIEANKPIIGICRGLQRLNTWFGGTLNQHIIGHQQGEDRTATKQPLQFLNEEEQIFVNSMHHQSIDELGKGFEIIGYTPSYVGCYSNFTTILPWREYDKNQNVTKRVERPITIEIIKHSELPILAFQYHPEEFNCSYAVSQIKKLIK